VIYWDTSCVLKLYTNETDSMQWQRHAVSASGELAASALLEAEMAYALEQKEVRGDVLPGGARALLRLFRRDLQMGRFVLYPIGTDVVRLAADMADRCYHAATPVRLRTLDGLHLATAVLLKCRWLATTDRHMCEAAPLLKLSLLSQDN
jgi:predicted nucleic acid-binding protein